MGCIATQSLNYIVPWMAEYQILSSGTTWTQEMVWLLCNNLDFQTAAKVPLEDRFKFLEFSCFIHKKVKEEFLKENMANPEYYKIVQSIDNPSWETLTKSQERRFIKTHLPFSLLPPSLPQAGCKELEFIKGNLRSKSIFSPTELHWEKIPMSHHLDVNDVYPLPHAFEQS
ncbi:hypothetical protein HUJ05_010297 [Dendroctonus ponderosae]|nr:hypothetical protein HUJ05_010297 [Dendroctonus ponderosae]